MDNIFDICHPPKHCCIVAMTASDPSTSTTATMQNLFRNNSRNSAKSLKHWIGFRTHRFQSDHVITVIHGGPTQPTYRLKLSNTPVPDTTGHPWRPSVYSLMGQRYCDFMRETQRIKQMVFNQFTSACKQRLLCFET